MNLEQILHPPLITAELPGLGGRIKSVPEDFDVEEIPAYEPCGSGDFLYLWLEKRDMGAEYFTRQVARRLDIAPSDVGTAGLKDRRAVTRQMVSVPAGVEDRLSQLEGDGIRILRTGRHGNKLKLGHLHGNRFRIIVRDLSPSPPGTPGGEGRGQPSQEIGLAARGQSPSPPPLSPGVVPGERGEIAGLLSPGVASGELGVQGSLSHDLLAGVLPKVLDKIRALGMPNYYGPQRFGREAETLQLGLAMMRGDKAKVRGSFLRKLALSAVQSAMFNHYLARRWLDGLLHQVLPGDVMAKIPFGGMFTAEDVAAEQKRFEAREIVSAGPIIGRKTFPAAGVAAEREAGILADFGLEPAHLHGFGKLMQGTRRHNLVYVDDLAAAVKDGNLELIFSLPAGCYATVLLREILKNDLAGAEEA